MSSIGLCIISYRSDMFELHRCLDSVTKIPELIDEIYITDTSKEPCDEIKQLCLKYNANYSYKQFNDDFSEVRNFNFDQASTEYILWLDSDDTIDLPELKKIYELKKNISKFDVWIFDYLYAIDENNKPLLTLPRERIVRNINQQGASVSAPDGKLRWKEPVHECIDIRNCTCVRTNVSIKHSRKIYDTSERNIRILQKQLDNNTISIRSRFYLGKELLESGKHEQGIQALKIYLAIGQQDLPDNKYLACFRISQYMMHTQNIQEAKDYAKQAISYSSSYAEPHILLGNIFQDEGDYKEAIRHYEQALTKKLNANFSQHPEFYNFLPNKYLALLYKSLSIEHANRALAIKKDDVLYSIVK